MALAAALTQGAHGRLPRVRMHESLIAPTRFPRLFSWYVVPYVIIRRFIYIHTSSLHLLHTPLISGLNV